MKNAQSILTLCASFIFCFCLKDRLSDAECGVVGGSSAGGIELLSATLKNRRIILIATLRRRVKT